MKKLKELWLRFTAVPERWQLKKHPKYKGVFLFEEENPFSNICYPSRIHLEHVTGCFEDTSYEYLIKKIVFYSRHCHCWCGIEKSKLIKVEHSIEKYKRNLEKDFQESCSSMLDAGLFKKKKHHWGVWGICWTTVIFPGEYLIRILYHRRNHLTL